MDIFTHGLVGATVAQAGARREEMRYATVIGFCAPLLADADALIRSADDPLLTLEYHRHFTHALIFIPFGALLAAMILWPFLKRRLEFKRMYLYALLGYGTGGLLDACTSYGTRLLWPFSAEGIAWSIISIFDPLFAFMLIVTLIFGLVKNTQTAARVGLLLVAGYLSIGAVQHNRAENLARELAAQRGHSVERIVAKPTLGNLLLWRSVYRTGDTYYVDAVRVGLLGGTRVYNGTEIQSFELARDLPQLVPGSVVHQDILRFEKFSDGFLVRHPERPDVLGDVRFSMSPTSARPLWGIEFKIDRPDQHAMFNNYREMSQKERALFISMLFGRLLPDR